MKPNEDNVYNTYDVVVCGGGPSGITAAIAAARGGATVALVERYAFLGGMATAGLVAPISEFNKNGRRIIGGIPWELVEQMYTLEGSEINYPSGNVPFDPEIYKIVAQRMLLKAGVSLYLNGVVVDMHIKNGHIDRIVCEGNSGKFVLGARYVIDCTGDADIAYLAGVPMQPDSNDCALQPATLCFTLSGVDTEHLENTCFRTENTKYSNARIRAVWEELKQLEHVPNFGGPWFCTTLKDSTVAVNMTRAVAEFSDPIQSSMMECRLREDVFQFVELLKSHIPEFQNCHLLTTATQAGYRESRRILGVHTLTGSEFMSAVHFEDTIARSAHPVDIHHAENSGQDVKFISEAGYIPYRTLIAHGYPNLLVAGRCISVDREAFASVRVQAPAMATGQAAGAASALCFKHNLAVDQIDCGQLRNVLLNNGAII